MDGTKLSSAKQAAVETIRKALKNKTEIAVLAFEGDCASPLNSSIGFTRNEAELVAFVNGLDAQGGTPLATALEATNRFMQQHKSAASRTQMILLLADGDDDCGGLNQVLSKLKKNNLLYRHETVGLEGVGRGSAAITEHCPPNRAASSSQRHQSKPLQGLFGRRRFDADAGYDREVQLKRGARAFSARSSRKAWRSAHNWAWGENA